MKTLELRIRVAYDAPNTDIQTLSGQLFRLAQIAANEGLLSGDDEAVVDEWSSEVVVISHD